MTDTTLQWKSVARKATAPAEDFARFIDAVCNALGVEEIADGVGELLTPKGHLRYAVSRDERFASFALNRLAPSPESLTLEEFFFVSPATGRARCGWSCRHVSAGSVLPEHVDTPPWLTQLNLGPFESSLVATHPPYALLSGTLLGMGAPVNGYLELKEQLVETSAELAYFQRLYEESNAELKGALLRLKVRPEPNSVSSLTAMLADEKAPISATVRDLSELNSWALEHSEHIVLLPRALNAAKKAIYDKPQDVYAALDFLANKYREFRAGGAGPGVLESALGEIGLRMARSVGGTIAGEQGEAYFVTYRGQRRFLEWHLLKGGGRDERHCLRIYFFYCEETSRCVVGWLPSHLSNSLS